MIAFLSVLLIPIIASLASESVACILVLPENQERWLVDSVDCVSVNGLENTTNLLYFLYYMIMNVL